MTLGSPTFLARIAASLSDGTTTTVTNNQLIVAEAAPSALTPVNALPSISGSGLVGYSGSGGNVDILIPLSLLPSGGSGGSSSASGSITAGSSSATGGSTVSFTFSTSGVSTPYAGWVANGSTSVGASSPTLIGSAVSVSGTSGSITAPSGAGTDQLALLGGSTGPVLALSGAVTVGAGLPAMTSLSGATFGTLAGITMLNSKGASFPASVLPSAPYYIECDYVCPTTLANSLILLSCGGWQVYVDKATNTLYLYTPGDGTYQSLNIYPNDGTKRRVAVAFTSNSLYVYAGTAASNMAQIVAYAGPFASQTGSIYVGTSAAQTTTIPSGGGIANVAVVSKDVTAGNFSGWTDPAYTGTNTAGLVEAWTLNNTFAGNT